MNEGEGLMSDDEWLARNARALDWEEAQGTESWDRAKTEGRAAVVVKGGRGLGRYRLAMPEGKDPHEVLLVKSGDGSYAGACSCKGFRANSWPCAHLCTLRQDEALDDREIAQSSEYVAELVPEDVQEEPGDVEEAPEPPAEVDGTSPPAPDDAFARELPDVPDQYVMELDGDAYIRRAGYARLAKAAGFRISILEVVGAHETEWERAKYRATVMDEDGNNLASDVGTAGPPESEGMDDAECHLDELAATRAATRALAWATGEGLTAVAEVKPEADR